MAGSLCMMFMLISGHWTGTQFQTGGREPVYDADGKTSWLDLMGDTYW